MDNIHQAVLDRFRREIASGQVEVHRAASADAAAQFGSCYFDWVYIDGNHLYEFAKRDVEAYYPRVKPGGFLTGDDYGPGGWWEGGVQRAVDEFSALGKCKALAIPGRQFILQKTA
jgi:hypothetical protein